MSKDEKEKIIKNYIDGYNGFDVSLMVKDFSGDIIFENIQNGEVNMTLRGIEEFKAQAESAKSYFSERTQTIRLFRHEENRTEIELDYTAVLAMDFPNGMKKGQELRLQGKSIFEFNNGKIIKLSDIS